MLEFEWQARYRYQNSLLYKQNSSLIFVYNVKKLQFFDKMTRCKQDKLI